MNEAAHRWRKPRKVILTKTIQNGYKSKLYEGQEVLVNTQKCPLDKVYKYCYQDLDKTVLIRTIYQYFKTK